MNRPQPLVKSDISSWITPEEEANLVADPELARLFELSEKLQAGTLSDEERRELDVLTSEAAAIDPNVLRSVEVEVLPPERSPFDLGPIDSVQIAPTVDIGDTPD